MDPTTSEFTLDRLVRHYLDWLSIERGMAGNTIAAYSRDLRRYVAYCQQHGIAPDEISSDNISGFVQDLSSDSPESPALGAKSVARAMSAVRGFHAFCVEEGFLALNPADLLIPPKLPQSLPKALTEEQVLRLLNAVGGERPQDLRDRLILELLYGTGMRISELVGLDVSDIDLDERLLRCFGKGRKERMLPVGKEAFLALDQYLVRARPQLLEPTGGSSATGALVLNMRGGRLTRQGCWQILKRHATSVGLQRAVSPHVLRHSCATHMLEHGADIRVVQELLGHSSITTTQIYTRVSQRHLQDVYLATHPRARITESD